MSYFPNYLSQINKLDKEDERFVRGFEWAIECAVTFFHNTEVFYATKKEREVFENNENIECFKQWMEGDKNMLLVSMFDQEKYENIELVDENITMYKGANNDD